MRTDTNMYFELFYRKVGLLGLLTKVNEHRMFTPDRTFQLDDDDVKAFSAKVLTTMKLIGNNDYENMCLEIGQEDAWFEKIFRKFVITQYPEGRMYKVFKVVIYKETPNDYEERIVSKREVKQMIWDYWESLKY